ncbi:MAG: aminopeptidase [Magnetococcales bacterium]|nr:aminopeptidase [Magnetococcales bacterium]
MTTRGGIVRFSVVILIPLLLGVSGCSSVGYLWQATEGQVDVLWRRQAVDELLDDPDTSERLKLRLAVARDIRWFAVTHLGFPNSGSFKEYADLKRSFAVWSVVAAPRYALTPVTWCYPLVGCLSYRGYFSKQGAESYAEVLRQRDLDVHVGGIKAYSTLGWFDDPLLNTYIHWSDTRLAELMFHEMAHELLYIPGDTVFNESLASALAEIAVCRWLIHHGNHRAIAAYVQDAEREKFFRNLVEETRLSLEKLYNSDVNIERLEEEKRRVFLRMKDNYEQERSRWKDGIHYDRWFASELNNARVVLAVTYSKHVPALRAHYRALDQNLDAFLSDVFSLESLEVEERARAIQAWLEKSPDSGSMPVCGDQSHPGEG